MDDSNDECAISTVIVSGISIAAPLDRDVAYIQYAHIASTIREGPRDEIHIIRWTRAVAAMHTLWTIHPVGWSLLEEETQGRKIESINCKLK